MKCVFLWLLPDPTNNTSENRVPQPQPPGVKQHEGGLPWRSHISQEKVSGKCRRVNMFTCCIGLLINYSNLVLETKIPVS